MRSLEETKRKLSTLYSNFDSTRPLSSQWMHKSNLFVFTQTRREASDILDDVIE